MPIFEGHAYETQMASDLIRDGMTLELLDGSGDVVADVIYSDATGEMRFSAYRRDLPLAAVEWLIACAKVRLPPRPAITD
jgi:hypothetical protein